MSLKLTLTLILKTNGVFTDPEYYLKIISQLTLAPVFRMSLFTNMYMFIMNLSSYLTYANMD